MEISKCRSISELIDHYLIRKIVFIDEQKVSYEDEFDLAEKEKTPFIVYDLDKPIGAARISFNQKYPKIERVCVLKEYRNRGIGKFIMEYLFTYCIKLGFREVFIFAQEQAISFYENLGFIKIGDLFYEANIPHYKMKKNL